MRIHYLNCFSCDARIPAGLRSGTLCLLIETDDGSLILVDTGPGLEDCASKPLIIRAFQIVTKVRLDPQETAARQVAALGYKREMVKDIVLTHMHFDHCGGLPDFPHATVHVHARELAAFKGFPRQWTDLAYVPRHLAHNPRLQEYELAGDSWHGFPAIRLPLSPEMWLVALPGHSQGHCAVTIRLEDGWLFHLADAAALELSKDVPEWLVRLVLGPHTPRLRHFVEQHPEMQVTCGHMPARFFERSIAY